ncbi:SagB/ThcOx family dehydrogenase [bacterium]|nr:SagB/ThcOx family dehydrogenase [bacterium]
MTNSLNINNSKEYHELTKHSYESVRNSDFALDWSQYPLKYKQYSGCEKISLPPVIEEEMSISTLKALSGLHFGKKRLKNLENLAAFLFYINGKTGIKKYPNMLFEMRAAPSAGALYPFEIYFASRSLDFLENGVYHYNPGDTHLSILRKGYFFNFLEEECLGKIEDEVNLCFILTTIFWRTCWKYRDRSYRYCCEDTGHLIGNILPMSNVFNLDPTVSYLFNDDGLNKLLGVDGLKESVIAVLLLKKNKSLKADIEKIKVKKTDSPLIEIDFPYNQLSELEKKYQSIEKIKELTSFSILTDPEPLKKKFEEFKKKVKDTAFETSNSITLPKPSTNQSWDIAKSIQKRRSSRDYFDKPISKNDLSSLLFNSTFSPRSEFKIDTPGIEPQFLDIYLLVNRVENIPQGIFKYQKQHNTLLPLKLGNFIDKSTYVSLEQDIVGKSGAVIILTANFKIIDLLGDRGYRMIHLEAGIIGQNIYLSATSLGLGCTGIGAFYDDDINELLNFTGTEEKVIYELIVGHPIPDERLVVE